MKNFILLAMSTLPKTTIYENDFFTPEQDGSIIKGCQSQLEPVVRYVLSKCKGEDVRIFSMCTTDTLENVKLGPEEKKGTVKRTVSEWDGVETDEVYSPQSFFEKRIRESAEYREVNTCEIIKETIYLNNPEGAIQVAVQKIREYQESAKEEPVRVWIDTHGGLRDVALLTNIVGYLLNKFTNLKIAGIYGTEFTNTRVKKEQRIIDQQNAFESLSVVTGMSDFMNFGNVDVLKEYYLTETSGGNQEINELIHAMQLVSNGTQFCDPFLYTQGLDALGVAISTLDSDTNSSKKALLPIFYNSIRDDYGKLLDPKSRTSLDIIERCIRKKQYQQALTFIEALMPEYFFEQKILYYEGEDVKNAEEAAEGFYKSPKDNAFDYFMDKMKDCYKDSGDVRNCLYVRAGILAGKDRISDFDDRLQEYLKDLDDNIKENMGKGMKKDFPFKKKCSIGERKILSQDAEGETKKEAIKIQFKSDLPKEEYERAGKVMRMHNVLKNSRNKFNHAVSSETNQSLRDWRPELDDIVVIMNMYVDEVRILEKSIVKEITKTSL